MKTETQNWVVIHDDSGTYTLFNSKAEADKWSEQFCPIGADGEGDMNVLVLPENHFLIKSMGFTERKVTKPTYEIWEPIKENK